MITWYQNDNILSKTQNTYHLFFSVNNKWLGHNVQFWNAFYPQEATITGQD